MKLPFAQGAYKRELADPGELVQINHYFEQDPTLNDDASALIARPGAKRLANVGTGPIRATYHQTGTFNEALFVASGTQLWKVNRDLSQVLVGSGLEAYDLTSRPFVDMIATGNIGTTPAYLFVCDGAKLFVYDGTTFSQVVTPDNVGIVSIDVIAGYVIAIPAQGADINGRFYWIKPGEITIDPLDFATAERSPDPIYQVKVAGDHFWLMGQSTTEVWYVTGQIDNPVQRLNGIAFDRGTIEGTAQVLQDSLVVVDAEGGVWNINGGGPTRISTPFVEARIRRSNAIKVESES